MYINDLFTESNEMDTPEFQAALLAMKKRAAQEPPVDLKRLRQRMDAAERAEQAREKRKQERRAGVDENAWSDGTNSWSSEHDQWTKENSNNPVPVDSASAIPGRVREGAGVVNIGDQVLYKGQPAEVIAVDGTAATVYVPNWKAVPGMVDDTMEVDPASKFLDPMDPSVAEQQVDEAGGALNNMIFQQNLHNLGQQVSQLSPEDLEQFNQIAMSAGIGGVAGVAGVIGAFKFGDMFMSVMRRTMSLAKKKVNVDTEEIIKLRRQIVSIHKRLKTLKSESAIAKYQAMLKQAYEVLEELEARKGNKVAEQQVDEVTGDLPFDTMLSKIVAGGNLQTLAAKIVAKINKFPQYRMPDEEDRDEFDWPNGYPDGHFFGDDLWIDDSFDSIMRKWKDLGPDKFADENEDLGFKPSMQSSNDYTNYWNGVLELLRRLESIPGAEEQLAKMVWHGLFSGSVEKGITDISKPGVAEGRFELDRKSGQMSHNTSDADQRHGLYINSKLIKTCNSREEAENVKKRDAKFKDATVKKIAEAGPGDINRLEHRGAEYNVYFNQRKGMYTARGTGQMSGQIAPQWFRTLDDAIDHAEMEIGGYDERDGVTEGESRLYKHHQELRKKSGLPDPEVYKQMMKQKQAEIDALKSDTKTIPEQWVLVGRAIKEQKLTNKQIAEMFAQLEQNRLDENVFAGIKQAISGAWNKLSGLVDYTRKVENFEAVYNQVAEKLKAATGGDAGVMQYIEKYRAFAKSHPVLQAIIIAAILSAAGIAVSAGGVGAATAAVGLLTTTENLLRGKKASTAIKHGAAAATLAYGVGELLHLLHVGGGPAVHKALDLAADDIALGGGEVAGGVVGAMHQTGQSINQVKRHTRGSMHESTNYWHKLQAERNTRINSLITELTESVKDIK